MAVQVGAHYLEKTNGGRGMLLGGVPGVPGANVVIIGGGVVGTNAAQIALGMGANVTILDLNVDRLRYLDEVLHGRIHTLASNRHNLAAAAREADLVIGGVLIAGARAPKLVTREMIAAMRPGSVVVDVAIDQGGCIRNRETDLAQRSDLCGRRRHPLLRDEHAGRGAAHRDAGALERHASVWRSSLADLGLKEAATRDKALAKGMNVLHGKVTYQAVAEAFGLPFTPLEAVL